MEKGNGHVSFLALFTGHRFKLAFHPQASFSLWKSSWNVGRLRESVREEPFPGVPGPMQSLCCLRVAQQVELLWESRSALQGKVGMPGREGSSAVHASIAKHHCMALSSKANPTRRFCSLINIVQGA